MSTHHYYFWSITRKDSNLDLCWINIWCISRNYVDIDCGYFAYILWYLIFVLKSDVALKETKQKVKLSRLQDMLCYIVGIFGVIAGVNFIWAFGALTLYYMLVTSTWDPQKLLSYVDWKIVLWVAVIIALANLTRTYTGEIKEFIGTTGIDIETTSGFLALSGLSFVFAWLLGSSSRFGAITVSLASLYGIQY